MRSARRFAQRAWRHANEGPTLARSLTRRWLGGVSLALLIVLAAFGFVAPGAGDPTAIDYEILSQSPASGDHWLGTDPLGRDVYAQLTGGIRASLIGSLVVAFVWGGTCLVTGAAIGAIRRRIALGRPAAAALFVVHGIGMIGIAVVLWASYSGMRGGFFDASAWSEPLDPARFLTLFLLLDPAVRLLLVAGIGAGVWAAIAFARQGLAGRVAGSIAWLMAIAVLTPEARSLLQFLGIGFDLVPGIETQVGMLDGAGSPPWQHSALVATSLLLSASMVGLLVAVMPWRPQRRAIAAVALVSVSLGWLLVWSEVHVTFDGAHRWLEWTVTGPAVAAIVVAVGTLLRTRHVDAMRRSDLAFVMVVGIVIAMTRPLSRVLELLPGT